MSSKSSRSALQVHEESAQLVKELAAEARKLIIEEARRERRDRGSRDE